jgi:SpoVK/Ycf46/Vps4 family AAA+-type ATPase
MGKFKVTKITKISDMNMGDELPESDYSVLSLNDQFIQMEYIEEDEDKVKPMDVHPGLFVISKVNNSLDLVSTEFTNDSLLSDYNNSKKLEVITDAFFSKLDIYKKYGIEVPKRAALLYGPAGTSKTSSIQLMAKKYLTDKETLVLIWPTDKFDASNVKDLIKSFNYINVKKMIMIIEDVGGVEIGETRIRSESSLLSLLDNKEKTFKIPILIFATTNHPEVFMGSLTNRPDRFDDKVEFGYPNADQRLKLLQFFLKDRVNPDMEKAIQASKASKLTPAHIRDIPLRMDLFDKKGEDVINDLINDIENYEKAFSNKKSMGFGLHDD